MILDFYLLELSKYFKKKNKKRKKTKIDEEVCPQIEKKVQEPSSQLLWNLPRVQYSAYKSSYVDEYFHIHKILIWKESTLLLYIEYKKFWWVLHNRAYNITISHPQKTKFSSFIYYSYFYLS